MFYEKVKESADFIRERIGQAPMVGVILGSGLGSLVDMMEEKTVIPYQEIPNFPQSSVAGHAGNLVIGRIGKVVVAAMQGRFHFYEGFAMKEVTYPIYVMKLLGIEALLVTNACGGINRSFVPGDLMLLTDYLNMLGTNPLIGENDERFGVRFPDMSEAYSLVLMQKAEETAKKLGIAYQKGVYAIFSGPCYETAAEIRAYERLGADAIGMSTVPETIVANYLGMKVLGIACITNMATGIAKEKHTHEEVVRIANESSARLCDWVKGIIMDWDVISA
ncbi:MAG: purine-nucleoside phosphorylase [Lachnospiraceae bacterium]|nr:purine-nucleoside phosphorylase [Lachnospiraceae bacterium]